MHQLYEFPVYTSQEGGNERWQLMPKLVQFTGVHSLNVDPNFYDNLSNMKLDLKVKLSENNHGL